MCPSHSRTAVSEIPRVVTRSSENHAGPDPVFSTRAVGSVVLSAARYEPGFRGDVNRHPVPYFVYVVEGGFTESCSNGCVPYGQGSLHFHPSDDPHAGSVGDHGAHCFNITPSWRLASRLESGLGKRRHEQWPSLIAALAGRCHRGFLASDSASDLDCEGTALQLIAAALRLQTPHEATAPRWVFVARDYLHAHVAEPITLSRLSQVSGVDRFHLARTFRRVLGMTPAEYVRHLRLESGCRALVETDQPIVEIALDCGYSSQAHFTHAFRAHVGATPAAYRRARRSRIL